MWIDNKTLSEFNLMRTTIIETGKSVSKRFFDSFKDKAIIDLSG